MKEESLLLLSDLQKLINQVVLIDYTIIILGGGFMNRWKRWLFIIIVTAAAVCLLILAGLAFFNIFEGSKAVMPIHSPMV